MIKPDHPYHYISPPDIPIHRLPKAKQNASTNDIKLNLLNLFMINFQSIISKRAAFLNLIDDHHPDIIFGTETWLSLTISTAEFLPANYMSFRKDRTDGYGGVLLAFRDTLNATEYPIDNPNQCAVVDRRVIGVSQRQSHSCWGIYLRHNGRLESGWRSTQCCFGSCWIVVVILFIVFMISMWSHAHC